MTDVREQHERVRAEFTRQAERWGAMAIPQDLQEVLLRIDVAKEARVLDVAAGTGLLSRALAVRAREIVAVDITPAMLERGRAAAAREGLANVTFVEGAAEALPFDEGTFDLAVTRFSLHHVAEPQRVVDEMVRVVRGRGRIAVIDLIAPGEADIARRYNDLERLRDPSHTRTLDWAELRSCVERSGARIVQAFTCERIRNLDDWIELAGKERHDEILALVEAEIAGRTEATGFRPFRDGSAIRFHHDWGVVAARA